MSNTEHKSEDETGRPAGTVDEDANPPLTDPDDPTTGNVDPVAAPGSAPTDTDIDIEGEDARLMGPGRQLTFAAMAGTIRPVPWTRCRCPPLRHS